MVRTLPPSCTCSGGTRASMLVAHLPEGDVRLSDQRALEESARKRCYVQLEQIGMCMLRGVYEMPTPPDLHPPDCNYDPTTDPSVLACVEQWVLPNCLLACKHSTAADGQSLVKFYDMELCKRRSPDEVIVNCEPLAFDPRPYADTEQVKLHSMHWPDAISARETTHGDPQLLSRLADAIRLGHTLAGTTPVVQWAAMSVVHTNTSSSNSTPRMGTSSRATMRTSTSGPSVPCPWCACK